MSEHVFGEVVCQTGRTASNAGGALAGGYEVEIIDRDPAEARRLAETLGGPATVLEPDASFGGEVVVFAVYYPRIKDAVQQYRDRLAGKVVVDITNPVDTDTWDRLVAAPGGSSAEEVAQLGWWEVDGREDADLGSTFDVARAGVDLKSASPASQDHGLPSSECEP